MPPRWSRRIAAYSSIFDIRGMTRTFHHEYPDAALARTPVPPKLVDITHPCGRPVADAVDCRCHSAMRPFGPRESGSVRGTGDTIGTMSQPKAMNLRFPDPTQRAAIEAAARQEGVSLQEYILSAAYARATAVEARFLDAFKESMSRSGNVFAEDAGAADPGAEQRAAELAARQALEEQRERGHAA